MSPSRRIASLALAIASAACSGAAPQALEMAAPAASSSSGASSSSSSGGSTTTTTNDEPDAGASSGGGSTGEDSGSSFGSPAPSSCPADGVVETGGNDSESTAQSFTDVGCGTLAPGAGDWWRFRLPASATKLAVNFSGKVSMSVTTEGTTIEVGSSAPIPFHPTADYDIQVTSTHSQAEPYVILVQTN